MPQTFSINELYWFAGLFEGEGSSYCPKPGYFRLSVDSTDLDVLERALQFGGKIYGPYTRGDRKPCYKWVFQGSRAAALAMTMYSLLGDRRRFNLDNHLSSWRNTLNSYDIVHGTDGGYKKERRRGFPVCNSCQSEHNRKCKEYYRQKVVV